MSIKGMVLRVGAKIKKNSPDILTGVGIVGTIGTAVLAVWSYKKSIGHIRVAADDVKFLLKRREETTAEEWGHIEFAHDVEWSVIRKSKEILLPWLPTAICAGLTCTAIFYSNRIMSARNVSLAAAYAAVDQSYKALKKRVKSELGDEEGENLIKSVTRELAERASEETAKESTRNGTKQGLGVSPYAKWFDESCPNYERNPEMNLMFLKHQEQYANDKLQMQGHLFLNEVYDLIGFPHTRAGAVTGWVVDNPNGDDFVDFGIYNGDYEMNRAFINGTESSLLLDFNVQGVVWDLI